MPHPVADRLDELRRRLRRAGLVRGAALVAVALIGGMIVAAALDALLRPDSTFVRLLLTAISIGPAAWVVARLLLPPLRSRVSDVELARRVERRDPTWRGRLASAAAFLDAGPSAGSPSLQQRIVEDVTAGLAAGPLPDLVNPLRLKRPVYAAAAVALVAAVLVVSVPSAAVTALSRIALPFAAIEWPRSVELVLLTEAGEPLPAKIQVGRGQPFRFAVRNRKGDVPEDLSLVVVPPDGRRRTEPVPVVEQVSADGAVRMVGAAVLFAGEGPLRFRVVGGDDRDMPFVTAQVVPPPIFERMTVTVTPPAYLQEEPTTAPDGVGGIAGVVGSSVTIEARANKPLEAAELRVADRPVATTQLSANGLDVVASFTLAEPGLSSYWFRLRDRGGFENPQPPRYELHVTADAVPEVTIADPPDDLTATADADLPVVVEATDDHGLTAVRLRFGRGGLSSDSSAGADDEGQTIPLFGGPDRPKETTSPLIWSLEPLRLSPGDRIVFQGEATDAYDLGPPHVGMSSPRTVTIVPAVEKRDELLDRQAELLDELTQARRDEQRLREAVEGLLAQWERTGQLRPEDRDLLARAELEQRRLASRLTDPKEGTERDANRALAELGTNRIDDAALAGRLERIGRELGVLREDALPAADRHLTAARKATDAAIAAPLRAARADLGVVVDGLDALLEDLGAWRDRRDLTGEASDLLGTQRELADETAQAAAETLGTAAGQLTDQQAANLERLGLRQAGLADRLARLASAVESLAEGNAEPGEGAPPSGDPALKEAAERLREAALPAAARAAGESIRGNDLGEAGRLQRQLLDGLAALKEALSQSNAGDPQAASLRAAAERLDELATAQEEVLETLRKAAETPDGLSDQDRDELIRKQTALRESAAAAARGLREGGASAAAEAVGEAGRSMSDGLERLVRQDDAAAERSLDEAIRKLQQAKSEADREADRLEGRLAEELVESLLGTATALAERQGSINREVARLDALQAEQGRLSRSQLLTLRRIAETQAAAAAETESLAEEFAEAAAVSLALRSAADRMRLVEDALGRKETGEEPQRHGTAAKGRLDRIVAALRPKPAGPTENQDGSTPGEQEQGGPPGEAISLVTQLELAKSLQEDLLRRTEELDTTKSTDDLDDAQRRELERIGQEQQSLTRLVLQLLGQTPPEGGEAPE